MNSLEVNPLELSLETIEYNELMEPLDSITSIWEFPTKIVKHCNLNLKNTSGYMVYFDIFVDNCFF